VNPELQEMVEILNRGGLIAWPTDTTWGLLANANHPEAIKRIYAIKGRPASKPLQLLVDSPETARALVDYAAVGGGLKRLMSSFWPGALTIVAPASKAAPLELISSGKVGLRMPADEELRWLIKAMGGYLAATSLNRSGEPPVASYDEAQTFDGIDLVRPGRAGLLASSVYELPEGRLLRAGAIGAAEIAAALEESWTQS